MRTIIIFLLSLIVNQSSLIAQVFNTKVGISSDSYVIHKRYIDRYKNDHILIFENKNYKQGWIQVLPLKGKYNLDNKLNDEVSSIMIPKGYEVRLYENINGYGRYNEFNTNTPDLHISNISFGDIASMVKIEKISSIYVPSSPIDPGYIEVYSGINYTGLMRRIYTNEKCHDLSIKFFGDMDNLVKSVKVPRGYVVSLYDRSHGNNGNIYLTTLNENVADLANFKDKTSFIVIQPEKEVIAAITKKAIEDLERNISEILSSSGSKWKADKVFNSSIKIKIKLDSMDHKHGGIPQTYVKRYNDVSSLLNSVTGGGAEIRDLPINNKISKVIVRRTDVGVKYLLLPSKITLVPFQKNDQNFLGYITVDDNNKLDYKLKMNWELNNTQEETNSVNRYLKKATGIGLDTQPTDEIFIPEQRITVYPQGTVQPVYGYISPLNFSQLYCNFDLGPSDQTLKIMSIFNIGERKIKVEYKLNISSLSIDLPLEVPESMLLRLIDSHYATEPNFIAMISTDNFIKSVNLKSHFESTIEFEGEIEHFDYAEVFLEIKCGVESNKYGPFIISSKLSTVGSNVQFKYIQTEANCKITVSGKAYYNMQQHVRTIENYSDNNPLQIVLSEHNLRK